MKRLTPGEKRIIETKRSLETPTLKRLGNLKQLTQAKGGGGNDGGFAGMSMV